MGLHYIKRKEFKNNTDYLDAYKAHRRYRENRAKNEFIKEQVNGTIFAHEGSEGGIL